MALAEFRDSVIGTHRLRLLRGGDELFPAMVQAVDQAATEVWIASYIVFDDATAKTVVDALVRAAKRGVAVHLVVDGFGCRRSLPTLRAWLANTGVALTVFRPLEGWRAWLQPWQLRRMHHKLCVVDGHEGFIGGINIVDDRMDVHHGLGDTPRLDFAVKVQGPVVARMQQTVRALWTRALAGQNPWAEVRDMLASTEPLQWLRAWVADMRMPQAQVRGLSTVDPVKLVLRDNLRRRGDIERSYLAALQASRGHVDLMCPYFFPGRSFWRALLQAAERGVQVRLVLMGKVDYRVAALASRALYDDMEARGIQVREYTPAFLHAKIAIIDDLWATVGSSNIDPLSLVLNLEGNLIVHDADFAGQLRAAFDEAWLRSEAVMVRPPSTRWGSTFRRTALSWAAQWLLRLAGLSSRY